MDKEINKEEIKKAEQALNEVVLYYDSLITKNTELLLKNDINSSRVNKYKTVINNILKTFKLKIKIETDKITNNTKYLDIVNNTNNSTNKYFEKFNNLPN